MTVRRPSHGSKHCSSVPIKTSNRFSPLSDAPTEKPDESAQVIGDSILRNETASQQAASEKKKPKLKAFVVHFKRLDLGPPMGGCPNQIVLVGRSGAIIGVC